MQRSDASEVPGTQASPAQIARTMPRRLCEKGPSAAAALAALDLLAPYDSLLLAVSGGPDSVALMLLAAQWPGRAARRIAVATVAA